MGEEQDDGLWSTLCAKLKTNDPTMNTLKVNIDVDEGTISIYDNGCGIPIKTHSQEKIYIPELIFSHLLSSLNYDNDEKKLASGHNGYGSKPQTSTLKTSLSTQPIRTPSRNLDREHGQDWESKDYKE